MQQDKYYNAEEIKNLIESVEYLCAKNTASKEDFHASIDRFVNNDTYKGDDATASKEFMNISEKGFIDCRIDMQDKYLKMLKHYSESFAEKVDSAPNAKIDSVTLDISQAKAQRIYRELDGFCTDFDNLVDYLDRTYGHITTFTKPRTAEARESLAALCGGDELEAGFIYEVKQKFIRFDEEESAYVDSLLLDDDVAEYKQKVKGTNDMLAGVKILEPNVNAVFLSKINTKNGKFKFKSDKLDDLLEKKKSKTKKKTTTTKTKKPKDIVEFLSDCGVEVNKKETDDGYFILDKSLTEIFTEAGVDTSVVDLTAYDDWYITGLVKEDGSIVYSIIKIREPMDEQTGARGLAVPFNSLNPKYMKKILKNTHDGKKVNKETVKCFFASVDKLTQSKDHCFDSNKDILDYFKNPESEGSYLIADFTIDKLAHNKEFEDGIYKLPFKYSEFDDDGGKETLDYLADKGIYDKKNNTISINDPNNLTEDERTALLLIATGDRDAYAYAAENQFHAAAYENPLYFPLKSHAIASDAGVGESNGYGYEAWFKTPEGKYYKKQYEAHCND